jgi:hypothetical protein
VGQRNPEHIVSGGFDRTDADKYESKRSNEFCEQRAKFGHDRNRIRLRDR